MNLVAMNVQLLQGKKEKTNILVDTRDFGSYRTCAKAAFEHHAGVSRGARAIGTTSANSVEFHGIRPRMYSEDLL